MAMKKAEMEDCHARYAYLMQKAHAAEGNGDIREALDHALAACEYIDGMMRYENKYLDGDFSTVEAFELILRYAPFRLNYEVLNGLRELLKSSRRIERNTSDCLADKVDAAEETMWDAYHVYCHLGNGARFQRDVLNSLGGRKAHWEKILVGLDQAGAIMRRPDGASGELVIKLSTNLSENIKAMCSACGGVQGMARRETLTPRSCTHCGETVDFVMVH